VTLWVTNCRATSKGARQKYPRKPTRPLLASWEVEGQTCRLVRDILPCIAAGMIPLGTDQMAIGIGRRQFIFALGGATVAWPLSARGQKPVPQIGVLMGYEKDDPAVLASIAGLREGLEQFGWTGGRNIQIQYRYGGGSVDRIRAYAQELVGLKPDVLLADTTASAIALLRETQTIPIVFVSVTDPVEIDLVDSLAQPGRNITGFTDFEFAMGGKWLQLLKEVSPSLTRVGVLFNPGTAAGHGIFFLQSIEAAAPSLAVKIIPAPVNDVDEIQRVIAEIAGEPGSGLVVAIDAYTMVHRELIISQAAAHRLPAVYPLRPFAASGGLISFGADIADTAKRAATYLDRIIRGAKAADLPVQEPTKLELVINLKTAKALSLTVPQTLLVAADDVIE
jgi:putative tryptophan/tyrosine transport system substrate-binding protein